MKARGFTFLPTSWTIAGHMAERVAGIVSWAHGRAGRGHRQLSARKFFPLGRGPTKLRPSLCCSRRPLCPSPTPVQSGRGVDPEEVMASLGSEECPTISPCPFLLAALTTLRVRKARISPDTWSRPVRSRSECSRSGITTNSKELFRMSERYRRCSPSRSLWPSVCPATIRTSTPESVKRSKR